MHLYDWFQFAGKKSKSGETIRDSEMFIFIFIIIFGFATFIRFAKRVIILQTAISVGVMTSSAVAEDYYEEEGTN